MGPEQEKGEVPVTKFPGATEKLITETMLQAAVSDFFLAKDNRAPLQTEPRFSTWWKENRDKYLISGDMKILCCDLEDFCYGSDSLFIEGNFTHVRDPQGTLFKGSVVANGENDFRGILTEVKNNG